MTSKIIIVTVLILLLASISVLFVVEKINDNYDYQKNWNVVYFENPGDNSLDFAIENHQGAQEQYSYEIFVGDQSEAKGNVEIQAGAKQNISPALNMEKDVQQGAFRVSVEINSGDLKYNIYKDIK